MTDLELKQRLAAKLPEMIFQQTYHEHTHYFFWKETDEEVTAKEWLSIVHMVEDAVCDAGDIQDGNHIRYHYSRTLYGVVPVQRQPMRATWQQRAEALAQIGVI